MKVGSVAGATRSCGQTHAASCIVTADILRGHGMGNKRSGGWLDAANGRVESIIQKQSGRSAAR